MPAGLCHLVFCNAAPPLPNTLALFGRGTYHGTDSTYRRIRESGFNAMILSSFYFHSNGDVYSGDDIGHPIIHKGKFVGNNNWLKRVASLRQQTPTSIGRIEILLEGIGPDNSPGTYALIHDWVDSKKTYPGIVTGTGPNSTLYKIGQVFRTVIGADAICIDDESEYDSPSLLKFGAMLGKQ